MILSELLGYTSIACWLGAQFPQVLENYRRGSCEGLALPFLANWFLGDISNLIGCLLTHQLPFQTYLATYFVFIDTILISQYMYYRNSKPAVSGHLRPATIRRASMDRGSRYRTLSAAAANVAAAAALAAQQDEQHTARWDHSSSRDNVRDDIDVDEEANAALSDSILSESGTIRVKHVSWSTERGNTSGPSRSRSAFISSAHATTESPVDYHTYVRGRTPIRDSTDDTEPDPTIRRSSRTSKRSAGMVLLGVWALFGLGHFASGQQPRLTSSNLGKVLVHRAPVAIYSPLPRSTSIFPRMDLDEHHPEPMPEKPSNERLIGRVFAWVCTVLYFTSRLPQFDRKSVEGLSIYLFIFAFFGNVFYVASIVLSPPVFEGPPVSTAFIRESIPYLIGSAGTLMFDITIVGQSLVYRPKRGRSSRGRRAASRSLTTEEEGLLSAGAAESAFEASAESARTRTASRNRSS